MKSLILCAIVALLFIGCGGGGFAEFYKPVMTDEQVKSAKSSGKFVDKLAPEAFFNNAEQFVAYREMLEVEYECLLIGISSFNGGIRSENEAKRHAKNIGANYYVRLAVYTNTERGTYSYMMPSTTTSNTNMNANAYGSGGWASGYGTATTTTTSMIPMVGSYSVDRYDQVGAFYLCP